MEMPALRFERGVFSCYVMRRKIAAGRIKQIAC